MSQTVAPSASQSTTPGQIPGIDFHPRALYILFATEMWERFGFYTIAATMTLFLQDKSRGASAGREIKRRGSGPTISCSSI